MFFTKYHHYILLFLKKQEYELLYFSLDESIISDNKDLDLKTRVITDESDNPRIEIMFKSTNDRAFRFVKNVGGRNGIEKAIVFY